MMRTCPPGEYAKAHDQVVMVFAKPTLRDEATADMAVPRQMLLGFVRVTTMPGETAQATVSRFRTRIAACL